MEVGKKIIDDIKDSLRSSGPMLDVKRGKDGAITKLTLTGGALQCGAPSSVSMSIGRDGKIAVSAKDGFINPMAAGRNESHAPTKSQLTWLKENVQKSGSLSEIEKAALSIQLDALIQAAPAQAPDIFKPGKIGPEYMDDPSQIRKLRGEPEIHYAEGPAFPDTPKTKA
jgi:hypothetical protein